ncbi:MAG TPA: hypothetical protein PK657_13150 [Legionella sp.]|nr:hypothetical protein [Legionella sp.]
MLKCALAMNGAQAECQSDYECCSGYECCFDYEWHLDYEWHSYYEWRSAKQVALAMNAAEMVKGAPSPRRAATCSRHPGFVHRIR